MPSRIALASCLLQLGGVDAQSYAQPQACLHGWMLPTAFIVGAQKCGTTSLDLDLKDHVPGARAA